MNTVAVTFKTVTPLFLGGSKARERAELRIPPIKSAIRYWYRAWVGRYVDRTQMREHEARDLGLTNGQSPILIRFADYDRLDLPQSSQQLPFVGRPAKRPSINAGEAFTLRFVSRLTLDWLGLPMALWLHCGGLGGRARRGAGILNDDNIRFPDLQGADRIWRERLGAMRSLSVPSDWPILSKLTAGLLEFKAVGASDAMGSLKEAEKVYKAYRAGLSEPDRKFLGSADPRVASPIHFRPFQRDDAWWVRLTVFKSRWGEKPYDVDKQLHVLDGLLKLFIAHGANEVALP